MAFGAMLSHRRAPQAVPQFDSDGFAMRSVWVDYVKAIGLILVVYGHVARGVFAAHLPLDPNVFHAADAIAYSFHMPLFFFVSGIFFFDSLRRRGATLFLASKVDSLLYLYVLWSLMQGAVEVGLGGVTNGHASWPDVLSFPWAPRAQFWFLYVLFLMNVVSVALTFNQLNPSRSVILGFGFFAYVGGAYLPYSPILTPFMKNAIFFILGMMFVDYAPAWIKHAAKSFRLLLIPFMVMQVGVAVVAVRGAVLPWPISFGVASAAIITVVSFAMAISKFDIPFLRRIGASSLTVYLLHIMAASGARVVLVKVFHVDNAYLHLLVGTCVGIAAPLYAETLLGKMGVRWPFKTPLSLEKFLTGRREQANSTH